MIPGTHVIVVGRAEDAIRTRKLGLQLRDTVLILLPGPLEVFAFLFRVPLEGTVAENVLKHGIGGLWIDGCRIAHVTVAGGSLDKNPHLRASIKQGKETAPSSYLIHKETRFAKTHTSGRWPTNLLLVHGPDCVREGDKKIKLIGCSAKSLGNHGNYRGFLAGKSNTALSCYRSVDGTKTVASWKCQSDCPVVLLDRQSGDRRSSQGGGCKDGSRGGGGTGFITGAAVVCQSTAYFYSGGASRFYPQFASFPEALNWLMRLIGAQPDV
jgi:hypothetical protein